MFGAIKKLFSSAPKWKFEVLEEGIASKAEGNAAIRRQLAEMGDDGTRERHVVHYAYFGGDAQMSADAVAAGLLKQFKVSDTANSDGLIFEEHREIASAAFDAHIAKLESDFVAISWEYDGWECAVAGNGD